MDPKREKQIVTPWFIIVKPKFTKTKRKILKSTNYF